MPSNYKPFPVWDLPTRLFHWTLACAVVFAWWSGEEGNLEAHAWTGYAILVLVAFRLVWGFVGSVHARFTDFVAGPGRVVGYLQGTVESGPGHNPLGGWSVVAMLLLLLVQGVSGLFNSDDVLFNGPFYYAASVEFRDTMGVVHEVAFNLLSAFIAVHVAAVLFYQLRRRQPLLQSMLRGYAEGKEGAAKPAPGWLALLIVILLALALWAAINAAPQPQSLW